MTQVRCCKCGCKYPLQLFRAIGEKLPLIECPACGLVHTVNFETAKVVALEPIEEIKLKDYYLNAICSSAFAGDVSSGNWYLNTWGTLTDWDPADKAWIGVGLYENAGKDPVVSTINILWKKGVGGSWTALGTTGEVKQAGSGNMVHTGEYAICGVTFLTQCYTCVGNIQTIDDASSVVTANVGANQQAEVMFALDFADSTPGTTYYFAIYDNFGQIGTVGSPAQLSATATMAEEAAIEITESDAVETVSVDEYVAVALPDALEVSVQEGIITVTDVPAAELPDPLEISVYDEVGVTDVVVNVKFVAEDRNISVYDEVSVADVVTGVDAFWVFVWGLANSDVNLADRNVRTEIGKIDTIDGDYEYVRVVVRGHSTQDGYLRGCVMGRAKDQAGGYIPGQWRRFYFDGQPTVFVPAGEYVYSDWVEWGVSGSSSRPLHYWLHVLMYASDGYGSFSSLQSGWRLSSTEDQCEFETIASEGYAWSGFGCYQISRIEVKKKTYITPGQDEDIYEGVNVDEWVNVEVEAQPPLEIDVYDEATVTEDITAELPLALAPSVFDSVTVLEDVTVELPDALGVSVFDLVTVEEWASVSMPLEINVYDGVSVDEYANVEKQIESCGATPVEIWDATLGNNSAGQRNYRNIIPAGQVVDPECIPAQVRVLFRAGNVGSLYLNGASIGERSGSTDDYGETPVRLTFNEGNNSVQLSASEDIWSDWVDYVFDKDVDHLIHLTANDATYNNVALTTETNSSYRKATSDDDTMVEDVSGYSLVGWRYGAVTVEVRGIVKEISVYDSTTVTEDVTVELPDALSISVHDEIDVQEGPHQAELPDALVISVFDTTTATDVVVNVTISEIEDVYISTPFDTVTVQEDITVFIDENPVVFDTVNVQEYVQLEIPVNASVYDEVSLQEYVSLEIPIDASTYDEVTVVEDVTVELPDALQVSVFEGVTVTEDVTVYVQGVGVIAISVYDTVGVADVPSAENLQLGDISVYDEVSVQEAVAVTTADLVIDVFDTTTVTDVPTVQIPVPGVLSINVFDTVTLDESVVLTPPELVLSVFDTVSVTDVPSFHLDIEAFVFDVVSVSDVPTVDVLVPAALNINVYETVSVTEAFSGIVSAITLFAYETVRVTESIDIYWLIAEGLADLTISAKMPKIDVSARIPSVDVSSRKPDIDISVRS